MSFWIIVLGGVLIASLGCLIYLVSRVLKFSPFAAKYAKMKSRGIYAALLVILVPTLIIAKLMGTMNTMIVTIHLAIFWLLSDLGALIIKKVKKKKNNGQDSAQDKAQVGGPYYAGLIAIGLTVIYLSICFMLAHTVAAKEYSLETKKDVGSVRIVQIADAHIGTTFGAEGFAGAVSQIREYNPDIVVITGDFVDSATRRDDFEQCCRILGNLNPGYGIYYVYGNHDSSYASSMLDEQGKSAVQTELEKYGVKVLEDETVTVGDSIYVIGRKDYSQDGRGAGRKSMAELVEGLDRSKYMIVLDHQPHDYEAQEAAGVDLVLSGHTHGGQMFPLKPLVGLLGHNDLVYGHEHRGNTDFIVTSGISDWELKFKSGCRSEFVVIDIEK